MDTETNENVRKMLLSAIPSLQEYYLNRYTLSLAGHQGIDNEWATEALLRFRENLDNRLMRFLETYRMPPKVDSNFDVLKDFRTKFTDHFEDYARKDTRRQMAARAYRDVPLSRIEESEMEEVSCRESAREDSIEDRAVRETQQGDMEKLNKEFVRFLNTTEKIIFRGMLDRITHKELIDEVGPITSGGLLTTNKVRHLINIVQFRFICWYGGNRFTDQGFAIRAMNKHPNFCSRFFGKRKLDVEGDDIGIEAMLGIARGRYERLPQFAHNKPKRTLEEIRERVFQVIKQPRENSGNSGEWAFKSKWYKGKRYDSPVVYVNLSGWAYCHVDKSKWDIFAA